VAIVFGKKKTKTPQVNRDLTPWEKAQQKQKAAEKITEKKSKEKHSSSPKFLNSRKKRIYLFSGLLLILIGAGYLSSPLSRVQTVKVAGNTHFSKEEIQKIGNVHHNDWIFPYLLGNRDKSEQVYKKNPELMSYKISRQGVNKLKITVKENMIAGVVLRNKKYYTILDNGKVVKKSKTQPSGDYPIFKNFHTTKVLNALLTQFKQLPAVVRNGISEIDYVPSKNNPNRIHLYMNDGNEVYAILSTFAAKMKYYPQMAADMKQKGIIDLEVGAYSYPFKNKSSELTSKTASSSSGLVTSSSSSSSTVPSSSNSTANSSSTNSSSSVSVSSSSTSTVQATN